MYLRIFLSLSFSSAKSSLVAGIFPSCNATHGTGEVLLHMSRFGGPEEKGKETKNKANTAWSLRERTREEERERETETGRGLWKEVRAGIFGSRDRSKRQDGTNLVEPVLSPHIHTSVYNYITARSDSWRSFRKRWLVWRLWRCMLVVNYTLLYNN